jgi:hypothetical protein
MDSFTFFLLEFTNQVRTSQETHLRLRYRAQPVNAVYCENHTEHINTLCGQNAEFSSCLTGNTLRLRYKAQPVNAV